MCKETLLEEAAQEYLDRQARKSHPGGSFDKAKRFYPFEDEDCCIGIRGPSRSYPYTLMIHCRSAKHVANLYDVDVTDLKRKAREIRKNNKILQSC